MSNGPPQRGVNETLRSFDGLASHDFLIQERVKKMDALDSLVGDPILRREVRGAKTVQVQTPAGTEPAYATKQTILLGGIPIPATVEVTPQVDALDTDVIVGQDVLQQFSSVTVDYKNHVVTFQTK